MRGNKPRVGKSTQHCRVGDELDVPLEGFSSEILHVHSLQGQQEGKMRECLRYLNISDTPFSGEIMGKGLLCINSRVYFG